MRYNAEIRAFDMLDQVHLSVRVFATDGVNTTVHQLVVEETQTCPGVGEPDPLEWLKDALIYLLEELHAHERPASQAGLPW